MAKKYKPTPSVGLGTRTFYGETLTEAKKNRDATIYAAFCGDYSPRAIIYRNTLCVVYRDVEGWMYRIDPMQPDNSECERFIKEGEIAVLSSFTLPIGDDLPTATKAATIHFAHWTWTHDDPEGFIPPFLTDTGKQGEFLRWCHFQREYRRFKAMGYNDNDCHKLACGWPADSPPCRSPLMDDENMDALHDSLDEVGL